MTGLEPVLQEWKSYVITTYTTTEYIVLYFLQLRKKKYKKVSSGIEPKFRVSETSVLTITPCDQKAPQAAPDDHWEDRTPDFRLIRPMLCQLS